MHAVKEQQPFTFHEKAYAIPEQCPVCGRREFNQQDVLWPALVETWGLNAEETAFINHQQGYHCIQCGANLRSMTLAAAINEFFDWPDALESLAAHPAAASVRLLELNEAGSLHPVLSRFTHFASAVYPEVDMQRMPYPDNGFDLVIHSDTLEHVPDPVQGLRECLRILKPGGCMIMTIPILPTRLTRRRAGLPPSYHGNPALDATDMLVYTEYGADFYMDLLAAGWRQVTLFTLTGPESIAVVGRKHRSRQEADHA